MCGRYTLRRADLAAAALRALQQPTFEEFSEIHRPGLYNIAPSQSVPVVRLNGEGQRTIGLVRWGLIPSWSKELPKLQPINARAETVATSGMFRQALERRRCLVPADGFYEWQGAKPPKQPYFMRLADDGIFAFAGLWERWRVSENKEPLDTFTIITTSASETMSPIHSRMPVILDQADYDKWLDRTRKGSDVVDLLKPFTGALETRPIGTRVNSVKNDAPDLIEPISKAG